MGRAHAAHKEATILYTEYIKRNEDWNTVHKNNQMVSRGRGEHWNRKVPDFFNKRTGIPDFGHRSKEKHDT